MENFIEAIKRNRAISFFKMVIIWLIIAHNGQLYARNLSDN